MIDAVKSSETSFSDRRRDSSRRRSPNTEKTCSTRAPHARTTSRPPCDCGGMVAQAPSPTVSARGEMDYLYSSLSAVRPENRSRTAKLLASSTRKPAQKVIEEAGEVALAAVKHQTRGIINESADLLYHLVALWHRAGVNPNQVWTEMRRRAAALGIAEKVPKPHHQQLVLVSSQSATKTESDQP